MSDLANALYPGGPHTGGPNQQVIDAGKAVTTVAPRPVNASAAIYGQGGPAQGGPVGPTVAEGIAKPAAERDPQPAPESKGDEQGGGAKPDQQAAAPFDPTNLKIEGLDPSSPLLNEFAETAKALALPHDKAHELLALHAKAVQAQTEQFNKQTDAWANEARSHFGTELPQVAAEIRDAIGTDKDAQEVMRLLDWSGLGSNASVIRVLHRLVRGY